MFNFKFFNALLAIFLALAPIDFVHSEEEFKPSPMLKVNWKFDGVFGKFDRKSIQRGLKVYKEVCSACHSLKRISFRNLTDIGFSNEQAKAFAASYTVTDGPNDEGESFTRDGILTDYFVSPYANKESAMAANNGAVPPDLSLMIKARQDGANYVYSLLTGYPSDDPIPGTALYKNPYFITGSLSMSPPLAKDLVTYDDGTEPSIANMAYDVVNFLQWTAEPEMEKRKSMGIKVILFLTVLLVIMIMAKKKIWSDVEH